MDFNCLIADFVEHEVRVENQCSVFIFPQPRVTRNSAKKWRLSKCSYSLIDFFNK